MGAPNPVPKADVPVVAPAPRPVENPKPLFCVLPKRLPVVLDGAAKLKEEPAGAAEVVAVPKPPKAPVFVEPKLKPVGAAAALVVVPKLGAVKVPNPDEAVVVVAAEPKPNVVDAVVLAPKEPNANPDVPSKMYSK